MRAGDRIRIAAFGDQWPEQETTAAGVGPSLIGDDVLYVACMVHAYCRCTPDCRVTWARPEYVPVEDCEVLPSVRA